MPERFVGVGVMSGTSLDGMDLCCAEFSGDLVADTWSYEILAAETVPYSTDWREKLSGATLASGDRLARLHAEYGQFLGRLVDTFIAKLGVEVGFVASHGHTIFHQPENGFTFQLGDGEAMAACLPCPLVANFRTKDVSLGGQGAPLVPGGEPWLFGKHAACLNLGGIANLSVGDKGFDCSPCNMLLNRLARRYDAELEFDRDGMIASRGKVQQSVLDQLNGLGYYSLPPPKSLGVEWFEANVTPIIDTETHSIPDLMRTAIDHISLQITRSLARELPQPPPGGATDPSLLVTGGGALNGVLMTSLRGHLRAAGVAVSVTEPDRATVEYKEALVFVFLGLRTLLGRTNVRQTVTGASIDSVSGSVHLPAAPPRSGTGYFRLETVRGRGATTDAKESA